MYATLGMIKVYFPDNIVFSMLIHSFRKKSCPCYLFYYSYYSNELLVALGVIRKIDESILQQNHINLRALSLFFTDYKHTLFLNGSTDPISAGKRYDKLLLDLNNNYVLSAKKHSCHERFAVLRLRSKTRKLKSTKITFIA